MTLHPPRVGLVGISGYGRVHLQHLRDFHRRGELVLAAAVVFPPEEEAAEAAALRALPCAVLASFDDLITALPQLELDLVVLPTPIHLHARMTIALVRAGVDVLVEKPLAATTGDAAAMIAAQRETGRTIAVGFQYLHAPEVRALKRQLVAGAIGPLRRLVVHAAWPRSHGYYTRNSWAGQLKLNDDWVLDSPVSNAMSHFLMVMLYLAGVDEAGLATPQPVAAELYRAQTIPSFDTAVIRMQTPGGVQLDFYGTHSSRDIERPSLRVEGTDGKAEWVQDCHARIATRSSAWKQDAAPEADTRERLLRDVLARRRGEKGPIVTPEMAAVHVRCIAELHRRVIIRDIPPAHLSRHERDGQVFTYVPGLDAWLARAAQSGICLAEAGAPWADARTSRIHGVA